MNESDQQSREAFEVWFKKYDPSDGVGDHFDRHDMREAYCAALAHAESKAAKQRDELVEAIGNWFYASSVADETGEEHHLMHFDQAEENLKSLIARIQQEQQEDSHD